jgi:hypothetical protein
MLPLYASALCGVAALGITSWRTTGFDHQHMEKRKTQCAASFMERIDQQFALCDRVVRCA